MGVALAATPLPRLTLLRGPSTDQGTLGALMRPNGTRLCYVMELPDRENRRKVSRIPAGEYLVRMEDRPKHGRVYHVCDVPGRDAILAHSGNWAGDVTKGWKTHSEGCLLPGLNLGRRDGQLAVLVSRPARSLLEREFAGGPFLLTVR